MSTRIVQLEDFADKLGDFSGKSAKDLKKAIVRGMARSIPDLVAASPVDTGLYAQSWDFHETEMGAIIGNHAPYAGVIEYGARPFKPPIAPLLAWAKRVLTGQHGQNGQKIQTGQPETDYSSEVWALALHTQKRLSSRAWSHDTFLKTQCLRYWPTSGGRCRNYESSAIPDKESRGLLPVGDPSGSCGRKSYSLQSVRRMARSKYKARYAFSDAYFRPAQVHELDALPGGRSDYTGCGS